MDWRNIFESLLGGGAVVTVAGSIVKGYELWVKYKANKQAKFETSHAVKNQATRDEFDRTWTTVKAQWDRLDLKDKQIEALNDEIDTLKERLAKAEPQAARVPDLESRIAGLELHFLDCARLISMVRKAEAKRTPSGAPTMEPELSKAIDKVTTEGLKIQRKRIMEDTDTLQYPNDNYQPEEGEMGPERPNIARPFTGGAQGREENSYPQGPEN